jgi:hypothetical protein
MSHRSSGTRRFFCASAIIVISVGASLLLYSSYGSKGRDRRIEAILNKALGAARGHVVVHSVAWTEESFFGDASYSWRLVISSGATVLSADMKTSDRHDLAFAVDSIEGLFGKKLLPSEKRAVWRKAVDGWGVYLITGDDTNAAYLLVMTM